MREPCVYIVTNRPNGILYVGVTADIVSRIGQHRDGLVDGFTKRYGLKMLVHVELHQTMLAAIQREKSLKRWPRAWKIRLLRENNPDWTDLYDTLL